MKALCCGQKMHRRFQQMLCWGMMVALLGISGQMADSARAAQTQRGLQLDTGAQAQEVLAVLTQSGEKIALYKESYALLIGISDYTNGWPDLPGVKQDIAEVQKTLENQGFKVEMRLNLTKSEIEQAFSAFISQYGQEQENRLLFYFAGHGHTVSMGYGEELGYIVPKDAPDPNQDQAGFQSKALEMQTIEIYAKRIQSKHALFLFDACFSGSLFSITRAIPEVITSKTARPVRQFITSGSAEESVPDESIFRAQFIIAIQGEADSNNDGYITGTELGLFLEQSVINYSRDTQHPQYGKIRNPNLDKGDFVFLIPVERVERPTPTPPVPAQHRFTLDDLKVKAAWESRLKEMESAYADVLAYEQQADSHGMKIEAWQRFHDAFAPEDNPYSTRDNELLKSAGERLAYWQNYRPEPTVTPTPVPPKIVKQQKAVTPTPVPSKTVKQEKATSKTAARALPTLTPLAAFKLELKGLTLKKSKDAVLAPINDVYFIRQGETVTITVDVESSDANRLQTAWTTGRGKIPLSTAPTNTYTAAKLGSDYVKVFVWDVLSGKELPEIPINIAVIPEDMPDSLFRVDGLVMRNQAGQEIFPEDDIYTIKQGQTVRITMNVTNLRGYDVKFAWTTREGKLPPSTTETNTYTATVAGSDYVVIYAWDALTGTEFAQYPVNINVHP